MLDFSRIPLGERKYLFLDDDVVVQQVKMYDNHEDLFTIRQGHSELYIAPFWEDTEIFHWDDNLQDIIWIENKLLREYVASHADFGIQVRLWVYDRLITANTIFQKTGHKLAIKIWYRPKVIQKTLFQELYGYFEKKYGNQKRQEEIYKITCQYVSDSDKYPSPHVTWGAVDVILIKDDMYEVDMGGPINYPWEISNLDCKIISETQKQNRAFLTDTMMSVGFAPLASEWWHFSYGDAIWAYFYGETSTLYNPIEDIS